MQNSSVSCYLFVGIDAPTHRQRRQTLEHTLREKVMPKCLSAFFLLKLTCKPNSVSALMLRSNPPLGGAVVHPGA